MIELTYGGEHLDKTQIQEKIDAYADDIKKKQEKPVSLSLDDRLECMAAAVAALQQGGRVTILGNTVTLEPADSMALAGQGASGEEQGWIASGSVRISGQEVPGKALEQWCRFHQQVLGEVKAISMEDSMESFCSMTWMLAFYLKAELVTGSQAEDADVVILPLAEAAKAADSGKLPACRALLTIGCDSVAFDPIKAKLDPACRWIHSYGFPMALCISYGREMTVRGRTAVYHELKPVSGTSLAVVNEAGAARPVDVSGRLELKLGEKTILTPVQAVLQSDGKLVAEGLAEGSLEQKGRLLSQAEIRDTLLQTGMIQDACVTVDKIYYTQKEQYSSFEICKALKRVYGEAMDFAVLEVPYLPKTPDDRMDEHALAELTAEAAACRDSLQKETDPEKCWIDIEYRDVAASVLEDETRDTVKLREQELTVTDEDAVLEAEPIDMSQRKYEGLSQMIQARKDSTQEIIYITENGETIQTYGELYQESLRMAAGLREKGVKSGDVLVFQIPDNREYLISFWACIMLGAVVAPLGVLDDYGGRNINTEKLKNICEMLDSYYVLASDEVGKKLGGLVPEQNVICFGQAVGSSGTAEQADAAKSGASEEGWKPYEWQDDETCLLIFTSGSTGTPKGVRLSQGNIFARTMAEIQRYQLDETEVDLNWMTLTHAAGIIWSHTRDVYLELKQIQVMSEVVLHAPLRLLDLMDRYRASITWGPNFAFTLIRDNYDPQKTYDWDLSCVRHIFSGGEANVSRDLREFLRIGMRYGMQGDVLAPSFGMAETSSAFIYYDDFRLDNTADEDRFVPIGSPSAGHAARITDEDGNILKKGQIGRIECRGGAVTCGYYKNEKANEESFTADGFLITGDMGYMEGGIVTLTGREKEIIIINGLNYYVQDIESVVNEIDEIIPSFTTAVSVAGSGGTEEILVVFSPEDDRVFDSEEALRALTGRIRKRILEQSGLYAKFIVPERKDQSIRTEIGKKQRSKYRKHFEEGLYDEVLCKTGVLKDKTYLSQQRWIPVKLQGCRQIPSVVRNSAMLVHLDNGSVIDRYVLEHQTDETEAFIMGLYQRCRSWAGLPEGTKILIPTLHGVLVDGADDEELSVNGAMISGFLQSFQQEYPDRFCRQIDLDEDREDLLLQEAASCCRDALVAYRKGRRYGIEYYTVTERLEQTDIKGKSVLVVGAMGGIGQIICRHLADKYHASLLLVGRTPEEDLTEQQKQWIGSLSESGTSVRYHRADASCESQLLDVMDLFGQETGQPVEVFLNLAGALGHGGKDGFWDHPERHTIAEESKEDRMATIDSKRKTSLVLGKLAEQQKNSTVIFFGSVNGILGGAGLASYSAANSFQDQYARYLQQTGRANAFCINWSGWYGTGLRRDIPEQMISLSQRSGFRFADPEENLGYFDGVLEYGIYNAIAGLDRENRRNRCMTNDPYQAVLAVYYADDGRNERQLVSSIAGSLPVRYLQVEEILRNSDEAEDVNLHQMRSRIVGVQEEQEQLTDSQKQMIEIWKSVLHLNCIGLDDDFFGLGGNSLLITRLVYEIEHAFDKKINMQDILVKGTVRQLVDSIEGTVPEEEEIIAQNLKVFEKDIQLDFDIDAMLAEAAEPETDTILMTGATSFIGAFVLNELVQKYPDRKIICFMRKNSDEDAWERLKKTLTEYRCQPALESKNLTMVTGELSEYHLGMEEDVYRDLCREIAVVYHCASNINFIASYEGLRQDNVLTMKRMLEFCCSGTKKELLHCSTSAVYRNIDGYKRPVVNEFSEFDMSCREQMGYFHSKMAGDLMAQTAAKHGLICRVFRLGAPSGTQHEGVMQTADFFWRMLKVLTVVRKYPTLRFFHHEFMPVDLMAKQIVGLAALDYDPEDNQFIIDSKLMDYDLLQEWLEKSFPYLEQTDFDEWTALIREYGKRTENALVDSIIGPVIDEQTFDRKFPVVDYSHTVDVLRENGLPVYEDTLDSLFENLELTFGYLKGIGFFEHEEE